MTAMGRMQITIRAAEKRDIPGMCVLLRDLFSLESDFTPDREKQMRGLTMLLHGPAYASLIVVAAQNDEVIGMGTVQLVVSTAEGGAAGLVEDIIVRKEYRGIGIGTAILSRIEEWCKERKATRIQLLADSNNFSAWKFTRAGTGRPRTSSVSGNISDLLPHALP